MRKIAVALSVAGAVLANGAMAESVSSQSRILLFKSQTKLLDNRARQQYNSSVRLQPPKVVTPTKWDVEPGFGKKYTGKYRGLYLPMARAAARRHGVPEELFLRLIHQESRWNPKARSNKGAYGLAQLMPGTAKYLGVNPRDPAQNLDGGAKYLKEQYVKFKSWRLALAAYNAGPGAVQKYGGIPPFRETKNYVRIIYGR